MPREKVPIVLTQNYSNVNNQVVIVLARTLTRGGNRCRWFDTDSLLLHCVVQLTTINWSLMYSTNIHRGFGHGTTCYNDIKVLGKYCGLIIV